MKAVLKLADREPTRIPSTMNIQRFSLAQTQLAQELSEKEHTRLVTDETTKADKTYMGYDASDSEGKLLYIGAETEGNVHKIS